MQLTRRVKPKSAVLSAASIAVMLVLTISALSTAVRAVYASPTPTTTTVKCSPDSVAFTAYAVCVASVQGSSPTGTMTFSQFDLNFTSDTGTFNSTTCTLSGGKCAVSFTFDTSGCFIYCIASTFQITGNYGGDSSNSPSSGLGRLTVHSCWFAECLYNTYAGEDFTDYICAIGNIPTDAFADCKHVDTDYATTGFDLSNQGIELPGAGMIASMAGCVGVSQAITFATTTYYASGASPGQVDTGALLFDCGVSFPLYIAGSDLSAAFGGKPVPDEGLAVGLFPLVVASGPPGWLAMGDLAVFLDLGCGFVNYYCYGANFTGNMIANPYNIQTKPVPMDPALMSPWGEHNGFTSIGWSLPSCTNQSFCSRVNSLCGADGTTSPCISPPAEGTAGQFDTVDIGHPDYSLINTNAPIKCATGQINDLTIGYDGDADFNLNSSSLAPLVNPSNGEGGSLGAPNGIVAEIPPADRGRTDITPDGLPVQDTLVKLRVGMVLHVCGRWVTDTRDLWNELHPITSMEILPAFTLTASPPDVTVQAGEQATYTASVVLHSGPSGSTPIHLSVSGLPYGASATFSANPVALSNPTTMVGSSTVQVTTSTFGALGDFPLTIQGTDTSGLVVETALVNLHIYDYAVSLTPPDDTVLRGGTGAYSVTLTLLPGSTTVGVPAESLAASGVTDGTFTFGSGSLTPTPGGASTTLSVATTGPPTGSLGDFTIAVRATSPGGSVRSNAANIHVYDFEVSATVSPVSSAYSCSTLPTPCLYILDTGSNGFNVTATLEPGSTTMGLPPLGLTLTGAPSGATYAYAPNPGTPTFTSALTVTTSGSPAGTYTITFVGTDSRPEGGTRTDMATLIVLTPQQALQLVIQQIGDYKAAGVITQGQANSLTTKLDGAIGYLDSGNVRLACLRLTAFANTANGFAATGYLRPPQSDLLLGGPLGVLAIMQSISC